MLFTYPDLYTETFGPRELRKIGSSSSSCRLLPRCPSCRRNIARGTACAHPLGILALRPQFLTGTHRLDSGLLLHQFPPPRPDQ